VANPGPRPGEQRKDDALAILGTRHADVWVATASPDGEPYLVPLSLGWIDERIVLVTDPATATVRNLEARPRARVAAGGPPDVVLIDARLEAVTRLEAAAPDLLEAYAAQADWDPRVSGGDLVVLVFAPRRIQVWRESDELAGRTVMRDGRWLV
jgi:hypothetical protein